MANLSSKIDNTTEAKQKDKYRVTNWQDYNKSLVNRGKITIWFSDDLLGNWYYEEESLQGGQYVYSDKCIECLLGLKVVYGLAYRQLQGFAISLVTLMGLDLQIPSYTQICRRSQDLVIDLEVPKSGVPIFIVADSTGLKVYGEGEWKTRKHGISKRRTWRKLHLGVDVTTGLIHAQVLTENGKGDGDGQQVEDLLEQIESDVDKFGGDGGYDSYDVWVLLKELEIEGIIPPQKNALYWVDEFDNLLDLDRNKILEQIEQTSRKKWKEKSDYHKRSLSETAMMRVKKIYGSELYSRNLDSQKTEAAIKIKCLNKMTGIGMPNSVKVAA